MSLILEQIEKARRRLTFDIEAWREQIAEKTPREIASSEQKENRRRFLTATKADPVEARMTYERILGGNELQPVNYLPRGERAARAVARIRIIAPPGQRGGWGTGFLIAPGLLLTNHHVLPASSFAERSEAHFGYEVDVDDQAVGPEVFRLQPSTLFYNFEPLDFAVVAIAPQSEDGRRALSEFGYLPLGAFHGKVLDGEWLTIIQHPAGERKQLCARENRLLRRTDDVLWYSTDTLAGSSGSPVFNNDWQVLALHHSGIPAERNGVPQTIDGRDFDPRVMDERQIKWLANEGIRVSRIVEQLRGALPNHPLLQPLFTPSPEKVATPVASAGESPQPPPGGASGAGPLLVPPPPRLLSTPTPTNMTHTIKLPPIELTLQIGADGAAALGTTTLRESALDILERRQRRGRRRDEEDEETLGVRVDRDYTTRNGYQPDFLAPNDANFRVNLPRLDDATRSVAVPLIADPTQHVLKYYNYSLVMHQERRIAIYTAANVRFDQRFALQGRQDHWEYDPRILRQYQLGNEYYAGNQFDRGHLTRREDMEYGTTVRSALKSAVDTLHWTNCTPQHHNFNTSRDWWQGLERHLLENAISENSFSAQIITGPVIETDDEEFNELQYPARFWKVVAAINASGRLFATAFMMDQSEVIARDGLEEAAPEIPFEDFEGSQEKIEDIERLTGLFFTYGPNDRPLSECEPLQLRRRSGPRPVRRPESMLL